MSLWGGRFIKKSNKKFIKFNNSITNDAILLEEEIQSSIAWSKILYDVKVLTIVEQKKIEENLNEIKQDYLYKLDEIYHSEYEDIHSWIEHKLIKKIGKLAKKLHTGRSRNDQITTSLRLWCKKKIIDINEKLIDLKISFLECAEKNFGIIFPGYTHLQRAQPITFSHWCLAYIEMFYRDFKRLDNSFKNLDFCPMGSGALSGISWNIDRLKLSKLLGFSACTRNSLDSVSDRDFLVELLSTASISMMHLSRFSEDLIFYNSSEANFIELSDTISSGSSLMPQKKNPDVLELIRGKCSTVYGHLFSILSLLKGLPLSYNKDFQEDKQHIFHSFDIWGSCLEIASIVLKEIKINTKNCRKAAENGYSNATEIAEYLVRKGVVFRDAHSIAGKIVLEAIKQKKNLIDMKIEIFKKYHNKIDIDIYSHLTLESYLEKRNSLGGVSSFQIRSELNKVKMRTYEIKNRI